MDEIIISTILKIGTYFANAVIYTRDVLDWLAGPLVSLVTLYIFYMTYISRRISVISIGSNHGRLGNNIIIMLKNHALREIYLKQAYLIYDNKYALHLASWKDNPYVIKPNGVCRFETEPYSYLNIDNDNNLHKYDMHVYLLASDGKSIHAPFGAKCKINKKSQIAKIPIIRKHYKNMLIEPACKYILRYGRKNEEEQMLQIYKSGVMSNELINYDEVTQNGDWFNAVPVSIIDNPDELVKFFDKILTSSFYNMDFVVLTSISETSNDSRIKLDNLEKISYDELNSQSFCYTNNNIRQETTA